MGAVVQLKPRGREELTSSLGMTVFLGSWAMMFCALFFAYAFMRARQPMWPPIGAPPLPVTLPAVNTGLMITSSFAFARGLGGLRRGDRGALARWVGLTLALGCMFLGLQTYVWRTLSSEGLHLTSGIYGSVFYTLTAFHALHVAAGLLVLLTVLVRSLSGSQTEHSYVTVRLCGMFWHFVDAVWVLMFVALYLL